MTRSTVADRRTEQGFTLIEALVAMVILIFGIAAVSNLMVIAGTSNTVANHSTATTSAATRQMELLESTRWNALVPGGSITADVPAGVPPTCLTTTPMAAGVYNCDTSVTAGTAEYQGVGRVHLRWRITAVAGEVGTYWIEVTAESKSPAIGARSRAYFTSIRATN